MADTSLIFNIIARDKTGKAFSQIRAQAASTGKIAAVALGPAMAPILGVGTAAVLGLGAAAASAGVALGVFGGVFGTALSEIVTTSGQYSTLTDKIKLYGKEAQIQAARGEDNEKTLKKQAAAMLELQARLKMLPPDQRKATEGYLDMKDAWSQFVDDNKPATYGIMAQGFGIVGRAIGKLQPFFDIGAAAAKRLLTQLDNFVSGDGLSHMAARAGPALSSLTTIIINVARGVGNLFSAFAGQGQGILSWLEKAAVRFASWSDVASGGGLRDFIAYVQGNGGKVLALLTSLALAAMQIAKATAPLAPISLAVASALASLIAAIPPNVLTTLITLWIAFQAALKVYAIASAIMTAAQWAQNSAFLASPITWIVLLIVGLIAVIVYLAVKTQFFQTIWRGVWGFMKMVGAWFAGPFANFFVSAYKRFIDGAMQAWHGIVAAGNGIKAAWHAVQSAFGATVNWISSKWTALINKLISAKNRVSSSLSSMWSGLKSGFRSAINYVIGKWNSLRFTIPSFSILGKHFGGGSIGVPGIPYMASGGTVQQQGLAFIHAGETVTPAAKVTPYKSGGGGGSTLTIKGDNSKMSRLILELLREAIRDKGGDVVKVLQPR